MRKISFVALVVSLFGAVAARADLAQRDWTVDGVTRSALVYVPESAKTSPTPVIFAFHGHGGSMGQASRSFGYHRVWPEAIAVYMQGLPTPGQLTDPEGKRAGWQKTPGDQSDRDLHFFDAVLASLKADYKVDDKRIYCTGHSNGGGFTYLLWGARPDVFAAVAPCAAGPGRNRGLLKPLPAMHVAGTNDPLVKYEWQEQSMAFVRRVNACDATGKPWASSGDLVGTIYASSGGTPFVSLISPGTHKFPVEAPALIVKFFKEHAKH
jgi:polyhydroxybutyrate depolymerase